MKKRILRIVDFLLIPFSIFYLPLLRLVRKYGVQRFPLHLKAFLKIGVFPVNNHYYEPRLDYPEDFDTANKRDLRLNFRIEEQLLALQSLEKYTRELSSLNVYHATFGAGDAEMYYLMIRSRKPKKIIEIGSGQSTLYALKAIARNNEEGYKTQLICIEPFEQPWLNDFQELTVIRQPVEEMKLSFFQSLGENDILFIDSSHIIRPGNDVLFEYLELLPVLQKGVLIHIHDIFSPRHYRKDWLTELYRFWNEQYLLEAFLYYNDVFEIRFSLNYLKKDYYEELKRICTQISPSDEPSSFWLEKIK